MTDSSSLSITAEWANVVVASIALFVAGLSIYFTRKSLQAQTRHNRLSVRPIPYFRLGDYKNRLFVKLENHGTGPLVIKWLTISNEGKEFNSLYEAVGEKTENLKFEFTAKYRSRVLAPGESLTIVDYEEGEDTDFFRSKRISIRKKLAKFTLSLDFSDIYGDKFPVYPKNLSWFARVE